MALVGTASLGGVWALFTQRNAHIRPFATPVFPRLWHSHIKLTSGRPPMHLLFLDVRGHNLFISDHIFFFSSFPLLSSFSTVIHCVRFFRQNVVFSLQPHWLDENISLENCANSFSGNGNLLCSIISSKGVGLTRKFRSEIARELIWRKQKCAKWIKCN